MANTSILAAFERMWQHVVAAISGKSDINHTHDDMYYTEAEMDSKLDTVNASISNITSGSVSVAKANEAVRAISADEAVHATSADNANVANSATKATQDASGNVITDTYETKADSQTKLDSAKSYTDTKVSGLASTSVVDTKISTHNTSTSAHNDIRDLIDGLTTRLNTLADSDDTTLDQMSEIVAYIKSNKNLIDSVTTSKVNVSDIVDNLTTNVTNKPLSAAQGVAIKSLIDALELELDNHTHNYAGSSSAGGAATSADKLNTDAGDHNVPIYFKNGVPVAVNAVLGADVVSKRPTANFGTQFRTDLDLDSLNDYAIGVIRTDEANNPYLAQYSSGLAWVYGDTQGFLMPNWNSAECIVGGGSGENINWTRKMAWAEDLIPLRDQLGRIIYKELYDQNGTTTHIDLIKNNWNSFPSGVLMIKVISGTTQLAFVYKHDNNYGSVRFTGYFVDQEYFYNLQNGIWTSDVRNARMIDLTNYLPLSGGTLSDTLVVKNNNASFALKNDIRECSFHLASDGNVGVYDITNNKWLFWSHKSGGNLNIPGTLNTDILKVAGSKVLTEAGGTISGDLFIGDKQVAVCDLPAITMTVNGFEAKYGKDSIPSDWGMVTMQGYSRPGTYSGDTYYHVVNHEGKSFNGRQINNSTTIAWNRNLTTDDFVVTGSASEATLTINLD